MIAKIPCPIPRCALEWHLASIMIAAALALVIAADASAFAYTSGIDFPRIHMQYQMSIAAALGVPGLLQVLSLSWSNRFFHRWAAFLCGCAGILFTDILVSSGRLPILTAVFIMQTVGEFYVFMLLRGATWSLSKSYSAGFPGNGSSVPRS